MDEQELRNTIAAFESEVNYDPDNDYVQMELVRAFISDLKDIVNGTS